MPCVMGKKYFVLHKDKNKILLPPFIASLYKTDATIYRQNKLITHTHKANKTDLAIRDRF